MDDPNIVAPEQDAPVEPPKPITFTSPSGRVYTWDKPQPPTQADVDAIVAFDEKSNPKAPNSARPPINIVPRSRSGSRIPNLPEAEALAVNRPSVASLEKEFKANFGKVDRYNYRKVAGTDSLSEHAFGNALDVYNIGKSSQIISRAQADQSVTNIIYKRKIWERSTGKWRDYHGKDPHTSHVHVGFGYGLTDGPEKQSVGTNPQQLKAKDERTNLIQVIRSKESKGQSVTKERRQLSVLDSFLGNTPESAAPAPVNSFAQGATAGAIGQTAPPVKTQPGKLFSLGGPDPVMPPKPPVTSKTSGNIFQDLDTKETQRLTQRQQTEQTYLEQAMAHLDDVYQGTPTYKAKRAAIKYRLQKDIKHGESISGFGLAETVAGKVAGKPVPTMRGATQEELSVTPEQVKAQLDAGALEKAKSRGVVGQLKYFLSQNYTGDNTIDPAQRSRRSQDVNNLTAVISDEIGKKLGIGDSLPFVSDLLGYFANYPINTAVEFGNAVQGIAGQHFDKDTAGAVANVAIEAFAGPLLEKGGEGLKALKTAFTDTSKFEKSAAKIPLNGARPVADEAKSIGVEFRSPKPKPVEPHPRDVIAQSLRDARAGKRTPLPDGPADAMDAGDLNKGLSQMADERVAPKKPVPAPVRPSEHVVPPETPKTHAVEPQPDGEGTSVKNESVAADRAKMGLEDWTPSERKSWQESLDAAKEKNIASDANQLATKAKEGHRLTDEESAGMAIRLQELKTKFESATEPADIASIQKEFDHISEGLHESGSNQGRDFAARKLTINDDYSLIAVQQRAKAAKGAELSTADRAELEGLTTDLADAESRQAHLTGEPEVAAEAEIKSEAAKPKKRKTKEQLDAELQSILTDINRMGAKASSGVDPIEAGRNLRRLAVHYVERGYSKLEDIVAIVQTHLPSATKQDVIDALLNKHEPQRTVAESDLKKLLREANLHDRIAKVKADIDAINNGTYQAPDKKIPHTSVLHDELKALQKERDRLIKSNETSGRMPKYRFRESTAARRERLLGQIEDLKDQLKTGNFKKPKARSVPKELADLDFEKSQLQEAIKRKIKSLEPKKWTDYVREVAGIPTALRATLDASAVLRQGLVLGVSDPRNGLDAFIKAGKSAFSEREAFDVMKKIRADKDYREAVQSKLFFSSLPGEVGAHEESFIGRAVEKIPVFGKLTAASERHMAIDLNVLRWNEWKKFRAIEPNATKEEMKAVAHYLNAASGRGSLGSMEQASKDLASVFFSARFAASRFQTPARMFMFKGSKYAQRKAIADMVKLAGFTLGLGKLAEAAGWKTSIDPKTSDFLKLTKGDQHVDMLGGFQQPIRLLSRFVPLLINPSTDNKDNMWDALAKYFEYKSAPLPSALISRTGKSAIGEDTTKWGALKWASQLGAPMTLDDFLQTSSEKGWLSPEAISSVPINFFGGTSSVYAKKGPKVSDETRAVADEAGYELTLRKAKTTGFGDDKATEPDDILAARQAKWEKNFDLAVKQLTSNPLWKTYSKAVRKEYLHRASEAAGKVVVPPAP